MQNYSYWQALPFSFYSKSLYQDVDRNWRGLAIAYLFIVCFICSIPLLYKMHNMATGFANNLRAIATQVPVITIKDGDASIDQPMPYEIKQPETNQVIAIIDSSETAGVTEEVKKNKFFVVLSKNKLTVNNGTNTTKTYDLSSIKNTVFDQTSIHNWLKFLIGGLFVGLYLLAVLIYFIPSFLVTVFYAGIAKLFVRSHHTYQELCRLATVALTPTLFLIVILTNLSIALPYRNIVYLILSLGYLTYAIEANRPQAK